MGRKRTESNGNGNGNGSARPRKLSSIIGRDPFRPLRLRGRRELVRAMVDALNDILQSERLGF